MTTAVLMYHRVCERGPATECYFERGTAVTPDAFARQVRWLRERFEFASLSDALHAESSGRGAKVVALTFDDGYRDVVEHVLPLCRDLGIAGTVFPCAATATGRAVRLWFDRYYDLVHAARARGRAGLLADMARRLVEMEPPSEPNLRWWVRGPLKEALHALDVSPRWPLLKALADVVPELAEPSTGLYLDVDDLTRLRQGGWQVGGHGDTHQRLPPLGDAALLAELDASVALLASVDQPPPWTFAYPDGAHDERVVGAVAGRGFDAAVTVDPAFAVGSVDRRRIPRLLARGSDAVAHPLLRDVGDELATSSDEGGAMACEPGRCST